jgi:crossover junction endodeoxyribonuclease RusA
MTILQFTVHGIPAPQGSKRPVGRGVMIESSKKVKPWREAVKWAAREAMPMGWQKLDGPLVLSVVFYLPRPKCARLNVMCHKMPDLSKLIRSTEDALTDAGVWADDARVASIMAEKRYETANHLPGARISVYPWESDSAT